MILDVIICTYNRQKYVLKNIKILEKECKEFINHIFVIDNASNLPKSLSNKFISIIHNKNLGGSGGFARGMYEAGKDKTCTHIMLMDDDIQFNPKTIEYAVEKLKQINSDDWLGFGMSTFDRPDRFYEVGANWNGIKVKRNNVNLKTSSNKQIKHSKYNYSGWWALIMPSAAIKEYGYPFPFFIKFDDVEYALRRINQQIIFDKNLFVHHENFKNKKSNLIRYYNIRNGLITNVLHFKHSGLLSMNQYMLKIVKFYLTFQYRDIKATNIGVIDYFKGPNLIKNESLDQLNMKILNKCDFKINKFLTFFTTPFLTIYYMLKILLSAKRLKTQYKNEYKYLISEKYWAKQFR